MYRILELSVHYGLKLKISWKFKISIFTKLSYFKFEIYMISLHGPTAQNKHGAHYVGLIETDERWKTVYSVWLYQIKFSGYPDF
jgi:hypothetical protein